MPTDSSAASRRRAINSRNPVYLAAHVAGLTDVESNAEVPNNRNGDDVTENEVASYFNISNSVYKYGLFAVILFAKIIFDRIAGIAFIICLHVTLYQLNYVIVREAFAPSNPAWDHYLSNHWLLSRLLCLRRLRSLGVTFLNVAVSLFVIAYLLCDDLRPSVFMPVWHVDSIFRLLWLASLNDYFVKLVAALFKMGTIWVHNSIRIKSNAARSNPKRGNQLQLIEYGSQLYRELIMLQIWVFYFLRPEVPSRSPDGQLMSGADSDQTLPLVQPTVSGVILCAVYLAIKCCLMIESCHLFLESLRRVDNVIIYGEFDTVLDDRCRHVEVELSKCLTKDELSRKSSNDGSDNSLLYATKPDYDVTCPICYDLYVVPTRLACGHAFCHECIAAWFDKTSSHLVSSRHVRRPSVNINNSRSHYRPVLPCPICRQDVNKLKSQKVGPTASKSDEVIPPMYWRDGSTSYFVQLF